MPCYKVVQISLTVQSNADLLLSLCSVAVKCSHVLEEHTASVFRGTKFLSLSRHNTT